MMVGAGGKQTCVHPHVSRPALPRATDANDTFAFLHIYNYSPLKIIKKNNDIWSAKYV